MKVRSILVILSVAFVYAASTQAIPMRYKLAAVATFKKRCLSKMPTVKTIKLLSRVVVTWIKKSVYLEDALVLGALGTLGILAYKNWATDDRIKARYERDIKNLVADGLSDNTKLSYVAAHAFTAEGNNLEETLDISCPTHEFIYQINRGFFWDSHLILIRKRKTPEEQAAEEERGRQQDKERELTEGRDKRSSDSPYRAGIGLTPTHDIVVPQQEEGPGVITLDPHRDLSRPKVTIQVYRVQRGG